MMKKKGSKPANSEAVLTNNSNETPAGHVSPANQPSAYSHGKDNTNGTDTHPGSTSKKKKKKKNKTKSTLSAFENAQQHMGAAVAAAAVADFHQHGADWFSSSSSSQTSSLPPPPPPPPLPPTPRQLPPASQQPLHHHHHHSHHSHPHSRSFPLQQSPALSSSSSAMINSNSKQRHQQQRNGPKNNNSSSSVKSQDTDEFWSSMSNTEERQKIREFWLQLGEDERRSLVKVEKEAVLRKMKEQQKHSCNCSVCGKKRTAIEDELEVLYDAYYEELEQYANHQQHTQFYSRHPLHTYSATDVLQESYCEDYLDDVGDTMDDEYDQDLDDGDDEDYHDNDDPVVNGRMLPEDDEGDDDEEDDDDDLLDEEGEDTFGINYEVDHGSELSDDDFSDSYDDDLHNFTANGLVRHSHGGGDHFSFGNSLTVKGGILTVADDLLKNDGKKFLDMMERLAERRMQRDDEADMDQDEEYYDEDEDDDDIYDDENEEDTRTEEQRMEEGRRMFQIFAARMFEQRVLAAYREKVAKERQQRLIQELEEEDRQRQERELKKQRDKERKKDKKRQLKQKQEEERLAKEAQRQADEAKKRAEQQLKLEAERQKREQERRIKEEEKRLKDEERRLKEEEKRRRLKEEKERAAEKERQRKEKEDYDRRQREFMKEKHRHEKELKDELARRDRELKEQMQRHVLQTKERTTAKSSSDATKSTTTAALSPPTQSLDALSISKDAKASTHHSSSTPVSSSQPTSASSSLSSSSNPPSTSAPVRSTQPLTKQHFTDPTTTSTSNPIEQHNTDVFGSSAHHTNNIFAPPSQHLFGNVFPHLDILQSSHPLLGAPLNTPAPPPHPQPLPPAPVCILPQAAGSVPIGQPFHHPVDATQERSSFNAINQFQLSSSSSNTTSSSLVNPSGIAIPSQHGRRASAMAGPIGSPLTHRFNGVGSDHNGGSGGGAGGSASNQDATGALGNLSHRTGSDTAGPDHTFFSNFLFGEPRGISPNSSTTTTTETDLLGHHISKLDMPLDRRFSTETSAFGWKNGWSATSMLSENLHGKLFDLADRQADRHGMLLDRARLAYQKLDEITQTNFFLGGTTPYHTMAQLHRMMNDFYCDTTVDVNELYDVLVQSPQSGFQCIQHPRHGTVVRYEGTLSTAALPASSTTATAQLSPTATDDPLALRRSSTLLHNPLASSTPSSSSFPSRPLPNHHPTHPIPLASSSHHLLHPQQYHLPPNAHLSPPLLSPPPFTYTHSLHSSHNGQTNEKESG